MFPLVVLLFLCNKMQREETFFMLMLKDERYICNVVFDKKSY